MSARTQVPAVEGLHTMDPDSPHLIGARGVSRESYFFPKHLAGSDPGCFGDELEEILLSRTGSVWSFTTSHYPPPEPYVIQSEPYEPFVLAAVELDEESMVVLGQMVTGTALDDMSVGMRVELTLEVLYSDDAHDYMVWKWKPEQP